MLRLLLLFVLLFSSSLLAADHAKTIQRADTLLKSNNKSDIFRAYNDYKNLYLSAVINKDGSLRGKALEGIVTSGKRLHIDVSKYERERANVRTRNAPVVKRSVSEPHVKKRSDVRVTRQHRLTDVRWKDARVILSMDKPLTKEDVNYFQIHDKKKRSYRYVFDIRESILDKHHNLHHAKIKRITLAQFKPTMLRFVIEADSPLALGYKIDGKALIVDPGVERAKKREVTYAAPVEQSRVRTKTIVIDPGHGGRDVGAVGHRGYREKMVVIQISTALSKLLRKMGYKVHMTRTGDQSLGLQERTKFANSKGADVFISIHANAVPKRNANKVQGIETYFLSNNVEAGSERAKRVAKMENSKDLKDVNFYGQADFINILNREKIKKSERLAHDLQRNMLATLNKSYQGVRDTGVREGPFWVLVGAQMPAVLIEVGFITHPTEAVRLGNSTYQRKMAEGIAKGIEQYFIKNP